MKLAIILICFICFVACNKEKNTILNTENTLSTTPQHQNKLLTLKIDYLTNTFEGGIETVFASNTNSFTIVKEYVAPSDIGYIKFTYQELNQLLFHGSHIWMGTGKMFYPTSFQPASIFSITTGSNSVTPTAGFEYMNIYEDSNSINTAPPAWWNSIQNLSLVRFYLASNPTATVKYFLYRPSYLFGSIVAPDHWIVFIKN